MSRPRPQSPFKIQQRLADLFEPFAANFTKEWIDFEHLKDDWLFINIIGGVENFDPKTDKDKVKIGNRIVITYGRCVYSYYRRRNGGYPFERIYNDEYHRFIDIAIGGLYSCKTMTYNTIAQHIDKSLSIDIMEQHPSLPYYNEKICGVGKRPIERQDKDDMNELYEMPEMSADYGLTEYEAEEAAAMVLDEIDAVSTIDREILPLLYHGYNNDEIGEILGKDRHTIGKYVRLIKERLAKKYNVSYVYNHSK